MSLVKEELDMKIEEGCDIRPILASHYKGMFTSENPQDSEGASSSQIEESSDIQKEKIGLSPPHNTKEGREGERRAERAFRAEGKEEGMAE